MQFIDLQRQYERIKNVLDSRILKVLSSCKFILGPEVEELEKRLADFVGRKYCVSCSSGTDALLMPLMAWGVGKGDAVFTTPFTFVATSEVIRLVGATPVFVDIDPKTFNISSEHLEAKIIETIEKGELTPKAVIPVDLFGLPADYDKILEIAKRYNLLVLEDAAQGFGGSLNGKRACSFGEVSATSFFPAKPLGCYGDGGAVFTDDKEMYELLLSIRVHGQGKDKYENVRLGINGRLDTIQAVVLLTKLEIFENELAKRNLVAKKYTELLSGKVEPPFVPEGYFSSWAQFSVLAKDENHRNEIIQRLKENGIPTAIYYPLPLHLQKVNSDLGYKFGDFPVSESISKRIFSLPMHPYLTDEEIELICKLI
ncbi:MAG: DegT/DnrJ/EryC1/StrS aminotransferase [Candidatus Kapaibacterium sp.]|jgi:dTDP-4-amino-4,6-dideoxygalactose transaminase|nr:MAG: DegT/DnrJ/EryC1/StrS aminotransferase [Candidatus Kapabacteria bacterium]ROL58338.1 MAG: DegT/DnrJ/EryC1/StrS family aminotransferase [Bacteroidetes/Chlorobi group bacterium Naka2016]